MTAIIIMALIVSACVFKSRKSCHLHEFCLHGGHSMFIRSILIVALVNE